MLQKIKQSVHKCTETKFNFFSWSFYLYPIIDFHHRSFIMAKTNAQKDSEYIERKKIARKKQNKNKKRGKGKKSIIQKQYNLLKNSWKSKDWQLKKGFTNHETEQKCYSKTWMKDAVHVILTELFHLWSCLSIFQSKANLHVNVNNAVMTNCIKK